MLDPWARLDCGGLCSITDTAIRTLSYRSGAGASEEVYLPTRIDIRRKSLWRIIWAEPVGLVAFRLYLTGPWQNMYHHNKL